MGWLDPDRLRPNFGSGLVPTKMSQEDVIAFLGSAAGHPGGGSVEIVETHGAIIFLAGDIALKIKREVTYDYMDLSTLALRERVLRRELALNQPIAPKIYRDVIAVTRESDGSLVLDGSGEAVEWVLRMWRFPKESELAEIAESRGIDDGLAQQLGDAIGSFHAQAPLRDKDGAKLVEDILDELDRVFAEMHGALGKARVGSFSEQIRLEWSRVADILHRRSKTGHVRRCHGDLHLHNLIILDGVPVPFDALEFDEVLGTCDVLYDLAFLLMDLHQRGLNRASNIVLSAYLFAAHGAEDSGLGALPLFLSVRAAIRAMVAVETATATHTASGIGPVQILDNAIEFLQPSPKKLVLIGGLSGTGKTTISRAIAPFIGAVPGAVHLRTDLERKALPKTQARSDAPEPSYDPASRRAVYSQLFERAKIVLAAGHSVLIDATFLDPMMRSQAEALAPQFGAEIRPIWLDAPIGTLASRVRGRTGDASDADEMVVRSQLKQCSPPTRWRKVFAGGSAEQTTARVCSELGIDSPQGPIGNATLQTDQR